jgi:hypothetical protein
MTSSAAERTGGHIHGTLVPVEEPSTASLPDSCTAARLEFNGTILVTSSSTLSTAQTGSLRHLQAKKAGIQKTDGPRSRPPSLQKGSVSVVILGSPSSR